MIASSSANSELKRVAAHRINRFLELGFSPANAIKLHEVGVDWHEAERLIASGCIPRLAFKILRP
jgi:hypothetical protein